MNFDVTVMFQILMGIILGIVGLMVGQVLLRLSTVERAQIKNTGRLIRIETRLGIKDKDKDEILDDDP